MAGTLFSPPRLRAVSTAGEPISGAKLYWYRAGTTVLASTYTSANLSVEHPNPQIADLAGEFRAIYLNPDAGYDYKAVCTTAAGVQLWVEDNIPPGAAVSGGGGGTPGTPGLSVAELSIYLRSATVPPTPTGGSFSFSTQTLTPPDGWYAGVPSGNEPLYVSKAVAAVSGSTGTDTLLDWTAPALFAQDGSSVDIIFKRSASQPATPAPSTGVPATWYSDVDSVPSSSDKLWSSVGTRDNASQNWIWQLPIQVEGDTGPAGEGASWYYIKPTAGTAIKNGTGQLTVEARQVFGGNDVLLSAGTIQLYVGNTLVTAANGFVSGSNGYTGIFDAGDIAGSVVVTLKNGTGGTALDTITLVDVADGEADTGKNAVYGYIDASNGLAFVRGSDGTTWTPASATTRLDCTFVQGGADVARVAWNVTRDADGLLTGATTTHGSGDLNGARVTVTEANEGTQAMTVKFAYSNAGDTALVAETVLTSVAGAGAPGADGNDGADGESATYMTFTAKAIPLFAYQNGLVPSYSGATGTVTVWNGTTDVTSSATLSISASSNVTGATINAAGVYSISGLTADNGSITVQAVYNAQTITEKVTFFKQYAGYEIVASLPVTNFFAGRMVFLTTDSKLYRYTGSSWTRAVDGADITANTITTNAIAAGQITAAQMNVTQLSSITANLGTVTAGILQSPTGGARFDLTNARIIFNSAPGQTGGYVRVQGAGFGPSSNYLDWYGPKPAGQSTDSGIIAGLTDAAAYYYLKTDGTSKSVANRVRGEFEPKAWCAFNGLQAAPQVLTDAFNVSGVTRSAAGNYRITFINPMPNTNYVVVGNAYNAQNVHPVVVIAGRFSTYVNIYTGNAQSSNGSLADSSLVCVAIFGSNVVGGSNITSPLGGVGGGTIGYGSTP